jgi:hypothetical protein
VRESQSRVTTFSHAILENPTAEAVRGWNRAAEAVRQASTHAGLMGSHDGEVARRALKNMAAALMFDGDVYEQEALVAARSGAEVSTDGLGRTRTEGPDEDSQESPRAD